MLRVAVAVSRQVLRLGFAAATLGGAVGIIAVLPSGCTSAINRFAFYPDRDFHVEDATLPADVRHITFATADGETVEGYLIDGTSHPERLVLSFHGNGGNLAQRLPELRHIAALTGATVLGSGYRGYGASTGRASEAGIYRDAEAALRYATGQLGYTSAQIVVVGRSLGSTVATHLAARGGDFAGVLLVTPLSTGRDFAGAHMRPVSFMAGGSFDSVGRAALITEPTLIIHGSADEVVPYANGAKLFAALPGPKRMVTIASGHHNDLEFVDPQAYWRAFADFVSSPSSVGSTAP